ncbi:MAG: alpha-ketoglutarate-dependent dioxygenase AlkB [Crocinitomicaceae bacterium]|nr:alpha-ketoglutarate-dependent dioxygenase AlkB [Crocinitomicaceae bacterium]
MFVTASKVLLNRDSGKIEVISDFNGKGPFNADNLLNNLDLRQESIKIFGKTVQQPRLSRFYSDPGVFYIYSKQKFVGIDWTDELRELKKSVEDLTAEKFNSALVNYYRDGNDSMGLHADNEAELGINPTIVSVNYGASRKMVFRRNGTKEKLQLTLNAGDLLIMSGSLQHCWKHEIPKQRKITEARLNITFRRIIG